MNRNYIILFLFLSFLFNIGAAYMLVTKVENKAILSEELKEKQSDVCEIAEISERALIYLWKGQSKETLYGFARTLKENGFSVKEGQNHINIGGLIFSLYDGDFVYDVYSAP
jgi:hypothetical protein